VEILNNTAAAIVAAAVLTAFSACIITSDKNSPEAVEVSKHNANQIDSIEIVYDDSRMVYIPGITDSQYTTGLHVSYADGSQDNVSTDSAKWSTDNKKVLDVDKAGNLQPNGVGEATITAEYNKVKATKTIHVSQAHISSVKFDPPSFTLLLAGADESTQEFGVKVLTDDGNIYDVSCSKDLKIKSEDSSIADIRQYILAPKKAGNTDITATVGNITAAAPVSVLSADNFTLVPSEAEVNVSLGVTTLLAITAVSGDKRIDVTKNAVWSVANQDTADAAYGNVTGKNVGSTDVTVSFGRLTTTVKVNVTNTPQNTAITQFP